MAQGISFGWIMLRTPDFGGFKAKRLRDQVHGSLHGEGSLWPPSATVWCVRHFIGRHDSRRRREVRNPVRTKQMNCKCCRRSRPLPDIPRSAIDEELVPKRDDLAFGIENRPQPRVAGLVNGRSISDAPASPRSSAQGVQPIGPGRESAGLRG